MIFKLPKRGIFCSLAVLENHNLATSLQLRTRFENVNKTSHNFLALRLRKK